MQRKSEGGGPPKKGAGQEEAGQDTWSENTRAHTGAGSMEGSRKCTSKQRKRKNRGRGGPNKGTRKKENKIKRKTDKGKKSRRNLREEK